MILWVTGLLGNISMTVALPSIYFIVYLLFNSSLSWSARKSGEVNSIRDARSLADQCLRILELLGEMAPQSGHRARLVLVTLSAKIGLLVVRYRRCLDHQAAAAAPESAEAMARAQLSQASLAEPIAYTKTRMARAQLSQASLAEPIAYTKTRMARTRRGILDVDHPSLRAARA